jgi:hypothetical protein
MLWDGAKRKMAARATTKADQDGYAVSFTPDKHSGSLRAKSFLDYIGWSAPGRQMLVAVWNANEKMLEVELPAQFVRSEKATATRRSRTGEA